MKQALIFIFNKVYECCLFPENCRKPIKNLLFGAIADIKFPESLALKNPFFWSTKSQISLEKLGQI